MSTKKGKYGFHIRDLNRVNEYYDNLLIEYVCSANDPYGEFELYKKYVEGSVVLDLGSHIGCMAKKFLDCGAEKVICVEPSKNHVECLENNLHDYGNDRFEILHGAVTNSNRGVYYYEFNNRSFASSIFYSKAKRLTKKVDAKISNKILDCKKETYTKTLVDGYYPQVLKVDVEMAEWQFLNEKPPSSINLLIIEWHNLNSKHNIDNLPEWINEYRILFDNKRVNYVQKVSNNKKFEKKVFCREMAITNIST
jgi:FkbM family methyltransferase